MMWLMTVNFFRSHPSQKAMPEKNSPKVHMVFNTPFEGNVVANVEGDMVVHSNPTKQRRTVEDMVQILQNLHRQHPQASEAEVIDLLQAEIKQIRQDQPTRWQAFRQDLLNPKRWRNGGKAALIKAGEHFTEESLWGKTAIAFLEQFSEETDSE